MVVVGAIDYNLRGFKSRPSTVHMMPLEKSSCTFCGTCVSMCPTGALTAKNTQYIGSPQSESSTICGFCGVGCSLVMGSVDGQVIEVNPSQKEKTVNQAALCVRGHFAHDFLNVPNRLTTPLIRRDGELSPATWDEAIEAVAEGLDSIKKDYGPQSLAFIGSSKCTVEENYLFQKMARIIFKTNNVDNGGYLSGRARINQINERLDGGCRKNTIAGLENAEMIFVIGANPAESVPIVGYTIKRASKIKRVPLIVTDPKKTALAPFSSLWLSLNPGSDCELINGLASILSKRRSYDGDFIESFTEDFDLYCDGLSSLDFDRVCRVTGIKMELLERAADFIEGKKIAFVIGNGILKQSNGISAMDALLNLALMTGSIGGDSKGFIFCVKENNQVGAWDMGTAPDFLPGRQSLHSTENRRNWEKIWRTGISPDPGLNMIRMIEEAEKGNLKALYTMGENPLLSIPQPERVHKALNNLELVVVQDILATEITHMADIVLPGAAFSEKGGSFTNLEGRIQRFEPVVSPPGSAKPDWEIIDMLFVKMDYSDRYSSLQKIVWEISDSVPMYTGLNGKAGETWIKETSNMKLFRPDGGGEMIRFSPVIPIENEKHNELYPFTGIFGSLRYHLGSGTRTGHSSRIKDFS
ncbi:MAG: molybdopterin-dependent oxidoreductase, partial [Thermodesulfobacteriota bacterium]|nr:molybdopterin-dependent oxidoreductase [Thermodesulfobacteriota bacterium]